MRKKTICDIDVMCCRLCVLSNTTANVVFRRGRTASVQTGFSSLNLPTSAQNLRRHLYFQQHKHNRLCVPIRTFEEYTNRMPSKWRSPKGVAESRNIPRRCLTIYICFMHLGAIHADRYRIRSAIPSVKSFSSSIPIL